MIKFTILRQSSLIAGDLNGYFIDGQTIVFQNLISKRDLTGSILPKDQIFWQNNLGQKFSAEIVQVFPLLPKGEPSIGKEFKIILDQEIPEYARI